MKNEKFLRNKLKKIKKHWPESLTPYLLPSGALRIVESHENERLKAFGSEKIEDILKISAQFQPDLQEKLKEKSVKQLAILISEFPTISSQDTTLKIFEEYFPSILERL